jgi:DNA mismatch endonuclease (patch repair protein)
VIFVHGCFWHGHSDCKRAALPKTNRSFWKNKIQKNKGRDDLAKKKLKKLGWKCLVIWQCRISSDTVKVAEQISKYLMSDVRRSSI